MTLFFGCSEMSKLKKHFMLFTVYVSYDGSCVEQSFENTLNQLSFCV